MSFYFKESYVGDLKLKNSLVMAPMCMYMADEKGFANQFHFTHYGTRAMGDVGLITLEATAVLPNGRISSHDLGIWSDEHIEGLKHIVDIIHSFDAKASIQIGHAGRKSTVNDDVLYAPSSIAFNGDYQVPKEMTLEEVHEVIEAFGNAAIRAKKAGFDLIQIHGAHGYLINEFLSPITNHRKDEFGGSLDNRARFLEEVIKAIKKNWAGPLELRVSAEEYEEEGNHPEDVGKIINLVKELGLDLIDVSSGGVTPVLPNVFPGYQLEYAQKIKKITGLAVRGGGLLTSRTHLEKGVDLGLDQLFFGRILLKEPYFVHHLYSEEGLIDKILPSYRRGY